MKLKVISQITLVLILLAVLLTVVGTVTSYLQALLEYPHWTMILSSSGAIAHVLLRDAGLAVFLIAFIKRLNNPNIRINTAFTIACILILLATLFAGGLGSLHTRQLYQQLPRMKFLLHMFTAILALAAGLCMSFFALTRAVNKPLAAVTLAAQITLFAVNGIRFTDTLWMWSSDNPLRTIAWLTYYAAYGIHTAAILLFLITFLSTPKQTVTTEVLSA